APWAGPAVMTVPGGSGLPADTNTDGLYDDVNGNGRNDFADVGPLLHAVRPAALLFGEAVRAAGCFIDVDALEEGLAAVARANAAAFSAPL
ncbi:MAG: hypothetical protein ABFD65_14815, partial [Candidatus Polarisedimenticolia bacterium]